MGDGIALLDAAGPSSPPASGADGNPPRESKREMIIEAVLDAGVRFWRDPRGDAFATLPQAGHLERYCQRHRKCGARAAVKLERGVEQVGLSG